MLKYRGKKEDVYFVPLLIGDIFVDHFFFLAHIAITDHGQLLLEIRGDNRLA
jgi:hypothetical protein